MPTLLILLLAHAPAQGPARACPPGDAQLKPAAEALRLLDAAVRGLTPGSDARPQVAQLRELLKRPCFELARENGRLPDARTPALAFTRWWRDGGHNWLGSYVRPGSDVVIPPDVRKVLTRESAPDHALAPLLCPAADSACGKGAAGWALRAEAAFERKARAELRRGAEEGKPKTPEARREACAAEATRGPKATRYQRWRQCLETARFLTAALPLGSFAAPTDGWLVLRGRRGHYGFCDEVRAYDLKRGAAYVVASCSRLALRRDGSVDGRATDGSRGKRREVGRLPLANLREAAWMTMLASELQDHVQTESELHTVPKGLKRRWPGDGFGSLGGFGFWMHSGQTRLAWTWVRAGRIQASGTLTWPDSADAGEDHAAQLWRIAEAGLVEGCPPAKLPRHLPVAARPGVSRVDADPRSVDAIDRKLRRELAELGAKRCRR